MAPTQKALLLPKKFGEFVVGEVPVPTPGAGEIKIKIISSSLNPVDWKIQKYGIFFDKFPAVLGSDIAGDVEELGAGVNVFKVGDRVFTQGLRSNETAGFQQYALARSSTVSKIPENTSYDGAASFPVALSAAYLGLYNKNPHGLGFAPPTTKNQGKYSGVSIVILGGSSSVGQNAIQLAKISGFSPIITTASVKHTDYLKALGATAILDRNLSSPALVAEIGKITNKPIKTVYDAISTAETQQNGLDILAPGGQLAVVDAPVPKPTEGKVIIQVIGGLALPHNIDILSHFYHDVVFGFLEKGWLKPNNIEVLPGGLSGIPDGLARLEGNQVSNLKLVARPQETSLY
ncbi:GroES-like protein [Pholiota conissans]|uniref:GroES-like protein n=1 Tax=Pholiota conissans TaxID=109636 RepID=A0A9P5ZAN2_9AGAR|nr:GroES-like protein [Pholiota conissans]